MIVHIGAGCLGIVSGFAAVSVAKGERLHRAFGTAFALSMMILSVLAVYLALFVPSLAAIPTPPSASVPVAILTFYFVATGWMTVRRSSPGTGAPEIAALLAVLGVAAAMLIFGLHSAGNAFQRLHGFPARYYTFAGFAAFSAMLDLKVILRGGISGAARIARHLWRMCFAFFFATSFFFLGQQRIMPAILHGWPLLIPALAPLVVLIVWLLRVRLTNWISNAPAVA
ncbi:MAG: hypothetical protein ABSD74_04300 [Rhizomicrobium sp.]